MSQENGLSAGQDKAPQKKLVIKPDDNEISPLRWITIGNVLVGIAAIIAGCVIASDSYDYKAVWIIGGVASGLFNFTLATINEACAKYINKKD